MKPWAVAAVAVIAGYAGGHCAPEPEQAAIVFAPDTKITCWLGDDEKSCVSVKAGSLTWVGSEIHLDAGSGIELEPGI